MGQVTAIAERQLSSGQINGVARSGMAFGIRGQGRPIVFIHGWCLSRRMWLYAEDAFSPDYQVILPDLAGFGRSEPLSGPYSLPRYAADFARRSAVALFHNPQSAATLAWLELAVACDLRYCADHEKIQIGVPEMDLFGAMPSGGGGAQFLARLMGPGRALQFILDAKPVDPRRALELGIVDRLCPAAEVLTQAQAFAEAAAKKAGPIGIAAAKRAILGGAELPLLEALEFDRSIHWDAMRRGNFRAGAAAFAKRFG